MQRDFLSELNSIIRNTDNEPLSEANSKKVQLYNIHKRSLPVGQDSVILFRLTLEDATKALQRLKTKVIEKENSNKVIYYDIIKTNANEEEKSPYYNPKLDLTIEKEILYDRGYTI